MSETQYFRSRWFEDIPVGEFHVLGTHTFAEKEMIEFGKKYDPQIQHIDPMAALQTEHLGLVASGWQLCAMWMRLMVVYMERYAQGVRDGRRNGAGVGFQNLRWIKPVRPGHTLTFTYEITEKQDRIVRNRWGIIRSRNEAYNQYGELVFSFEVDILAELNPAARQG